MSKAAVFAKAPYLSKDFFMRTSKALQNAYRLFKKYGVEEIVIGQQGHLRLYLGSLEHFTALTKDLPNCTTESYTSSDLKLHICKPTDSIEITFCEQGRAHCDW